MPQQNKYRSGDDCVIAAINKMWLTKLNKLKTVINDKAIHKVKDQNYITANYSVAIEVPRPAEVVFNHIINDIPKYWPEDFEGECGKLGDEFVFTSEEGLHYSKSKVTEFIPNKKVVWLVTESLRKTDNFDWSGTKMIFELTSQGVGTIVKFTIDGVVLENEHDRLVQLSDMVIKENLYNLILSDPDK